MLQGLQMFGQALLGFLTPGTILDVALGHRGWGSSWGCCPA